MKKVFPYVLYMAYRKRYPRRRVVSKPRRRKVYSSVRKTSSVKKMVRRELARNIENKHSQAVNLNTNLLGCANPAFASNNILCLSPNSTMNPIAQSVGVNGRTGNRIKIKNLTFKGVIWPLPYSASLNAFPRPQQVKLFIFSVKDQPTTFPTITDAAGSFFEFGNGTSNLYDDLVSDIAKVNTDKYTLHTTRTFKVGYAASEGTGVSLGQQAYTNNDFKLNCKFSINITKYCVKNVIYRDNNSDPSTRSVFAMFVPMDADGGSIGPSAYRAAMSYYVDLNYEDA